MLFNICKTYSTNNICIIQIKQKTVTIDLISKATIKHLNEWMLTQKKINEQMSTLSSVWFSNVTMIQRMKIEICLFHQIHSITNVWPSLNLFYIGTKNENNEWLIDHYWFSEKKRKTKWNNDWIWRLFSTGTDCTVRPSSSPSPSSWNGTCSTIILSSSCDGIQ